jgi:hypothetical protein
MRHRPTPTSPSYKLTQKRNVPLWAWTLPIATTVAIVTPAPRYHQLACVLSAFFLSFFLTMQHVVHCGVYASRLRDRAPSISGLRFRCGVGGLLACLLACMCVLFPLLHVYSINRTNTASSPFHLYAEYEDIAFLLISIRWFAFACSHSRMHGRTTTQTASFLPSCPLPTARYPGVGPGGWGWG